MKSKQNVKHMLMMWDALPAKVDILYIIIIVLKTHKNVYILITNLVIFLIVIDLNYLFEHKLILKIKDK